jgi:hypothetical protein
MRTWSRRADRRARAGSPWRRSPSVAARLANLRAVCSMRSLPGSGTPRVRRRRLLGVAGDRNRGKPGAGLERLRRAKRSSVTAVPPTAGLELAVAAGAHLANWREESATDLRPPLIEPRVLRKGCLDSHDAPRLVCDRMRRVANAPPRVPITSAGQCAVGVRDGRCSATVSRQSCQGVGRTRC